MRERAKVALVTARSAVDVDVEMPLLSTALAVEVDVAVVVWDDTQVSWEEFDLAVIRSTWDYPRRPREFLAWADRCASATRLANSAPLIRWNVDKGYLRALRSAGVAVVPTTYLPPGASIDLPDDREYVVKPVVGAGGRYAARYQPTDREAAHAHVRQLHAMNRGAMVQPYLHSIESAGERALVFVGGDFLHAIRKGPALARGLDYSAPRTAHPGERPWPATADEIALARQALTALTALTAEEQPLYARVDLVDDARGQPVVMELELIEPTLFLATHPDSVAVVTRSIAQAAAAARWRVSTEHRGTPRSGSERRRWAGR